MGKPMALEVVVYRNGHLLRSEVFGLGGELTVGRDGRCDLNLDGHTVSRMHCSLRVERGELWVRDLGSSNGVWMDGVRVQDERNLALHSILGVGPYELRARVRSAERPASRKATLHEITRIDAKPAVPSPRGPSPDMKIGRGPKDKEGEGHEARSASLPSASVQVPWGEGRSGLLVEPNRPMPLGEQQTEAAPREKAMCKPAEPATQGAIEAKLLTWPFRDPRVLLARISVLQRGQTMARTELGQASEQYVLGHSMKNGDVVPCVAHRGLRLVRAHEDGRIDMVFPGEARGFLRRDGTMTALVTLGAGRPYSRFQLYEGDEVEVVLGEGADELTYRIAVVRMGEDSG